MLMSLGLFAFSLPTLAYDELSRRTSWRHAAGERFGARAANQYVGPGDDSITLSGTLVPELIGTLSSIDILREMGDQGEAWPLVDGTGRVYGSFVISSLDTKQSYIMDNGAPRRTDFTLELGRID